MPSDATKRNRPKHQHWVPQFYLRYFATPESRHTDQPRVWIFSISQDSHKEELTLVRNVCGKRYLYSPLEKDGERHWDLEDKLGDLETLLGKIWPVLIDGQLDLANEYVRKGISLFTAVMYVRNPEVRKQVELTHQRLLQFFDSMPKNQHGIPLVSGIEHKGRVHQFDPSGWPEFQAWSKDDHDSFFADIVQSEAMHIAGLLMKKRWSIVCANHDAFVTSDCPVSLHHEIREKVGFGTDGATIMFPLSPRRMLVMDDLHAEPANQCYPLREGNEASFNFSIWRTAERYMITGRPVGEVLQEICALGDSPVNE